MSQALSQDIIFRHHVSLACSILWQILSFHLFFMSLTILMSAAQVLCYLIWACLMLFSWLDWNYAFLGRWPQRWTSILITSYWCVLGVHALNMISLWRAWPSSPGWGSVCQDTLLQSPNVSFFNVKSIHVLCNRFCDFFVFPTLWTLFL